MKNLGRKIGGQIWECRKLWRSDRLMEEISGERQFAATGVAANWRSPLISRVGTRSIPLPRAWLNCDVRRRSRREEALICSYSSKDQSLLTSAPTIFRQALSGL